jgi:hypothetical protein
MQSPLVDSAWTIHAAGIIPERASTKRPTAVDVAQRHAHAIGAMLDPNDLAAELNAARGE